MPILVHLADEREAASIKRNGIKIGKHRKGIYCMPVLPNFYVSHQWLRELKRWGVKTFVGVYSRLDSQTPVYAGRYNKPHQLIQLGEAIQDIMSLDDPLGYELIIDRKIEPNEIEKVRSLPQTLGWRYYPSSNSQKPTCACRVCIPSGSIKGRRLREKIAPKEPEMPYSEILLNLQATEDESEIEHLLWKIAKRKRRSDPMALAFLLKRNSREIHQSLALTLRSYRHKNTRAMLSELLDSTDDTTKDFAADSMLRLYGRDMEQTLLAMNDPEINRAVNDWKECKGISDE